MVPLPRRFALARGGALGALALAGLLAACEAKLPTAAEIEKLDVSGAEKALAKVRLLTPSAEDETVYYVDEVQVTAREAHAVGSQRIGTVRILRGDGDGAGLSEVRISTRPAPEGPEVGEGEITLARKMAAAGEERPAGEASPARVRIPEGDPLIFIDGVPADAAALRALNPAVMESMEILKGETATRLYGSRGVRGVVRITTRK